MLSKKTESGEIKNLIADNMKREIYLMREVLNNMHQEEKALMIFDRSSWNRTLEERFPLVQKLRFLREDRQMKVEQIQVKGQKLPIEKLFPTLDEDSCEIMLLSDQLLALVEKTNAQFVKNEMLMKDYLLHFNIRTPSYGEQRWPHQELAKKTVKTSIATYPPQTP